VTALLRVVLACAALTALGASLLPRRAGQGLSAGWWACRMAVGLSAAIPLCSILGALGMPLTLPWILAALLSPSAAALLLRRARGSSTDSVPSRPITPWLLLSVGALLVFVWKVLVVPLWTWDHFAIWGMKSRRMLPDGILRVDFLSTPAFGNTHPDYPIGAPMAWRIFSLGALPDDVTVKLVHVLLGVALAIVFYRLLTVSGLPYRSAETWTGLVVISPLFWDTESLGNADLALSFLAVAALTLLLDPVPSAALAGAAGITAGALPWIKTEGVILSALILLGFAVARRPTPQAPGFLRLQLLGAAATGALLVCFHALQLPTGAKFLAGDWVERAAERASNPRPLLAAIGSTLTHPDWIGAWILFAAALAIALVRRSRAAIWIASLVIGQAVFYCFTYFATYLNPLDHVRSSFHRIMAALLPIAIAATAISLCGRRRSDPLDTGGAARF
jgi:hypothetical protein